MSIPGGLQLASGLPYTSERAQAAKFHYERHLQTWADNPPFFSEGTFEFWQKIAAGSFSIARCSACSRTYFPPRVVCPSCWALDAATLVDTAGRGVVFSFTEIHALPATLRQIAPLLMACVDLDEGVRLLTWCRAGHRQLRIGSRCRMSVETILGKPRYVAVPCD